MAGGAPARADLDISRIEGSNPSVTSTGKLLAFTLDRQRYALHLSSVERVIPAVEITPLPQAPEIILGVIDVRGEILSVIDMRKRCRLPERELDLDDQLIISYTSRRSVALVVDAVTGIIEGTGEKLVDSGDILPNLKYIEGVVRLEDDMVLIHDLDGFLSLEEERALDSALEARRKR